MAGWSPVGEVVEEDQASPTWGDYGQAVVAGVRDVQGMYRAAGRYLAEKAGDRESEAYYRAGEQLSEMDRQDAISGMSEAGRRRIEATITSEEFWRHPFSSTTLKAARQTPTLAAAITPAVFLPGVGGATLGAAVAGGAMTAASTLDDIYKLVDEAPEDKLMSVPYYAGLRTMGMSEEDARRDYGDMIRANKPLIAFALGAVTNAIGPAGQIARTVKGGAAGIGTAGQGILARTGKSAGQGAVSEFVEEGGQDILAQRAAIEGQLQENYDPRRTFDAAAEGGLLGGVFSGVAGAASRGRSRVEVTQPLTPTAEETVAIESSRPPAPVGAQPPAPTAAPEAPIPASAPAPELGTAVTSEGNQLAAEPAIEPAVAPPVEAEAVVEPVASPEVEPAIEPVVEAPVEPAAPRAPRILPDLTAPKVEPTDLEAQVRKNLKEAEPKVSEGGHRSKAFTADREAQDAAAKTIFDEEVPADRTYPKNAAERHALRESLLRVLKRYEEAGVKIRSKVGYETTSDYIVYAREVEQMVRSLSKKGMAPARLGEHIATFLAREKAAKGGDFSVMRTERKSEGDQAKRVAQGEVEGLAASGPDIEKDAVATLVPKSAKGRVRSVEAPTEEARVITKQGKIEAVERARAASAVKQVEVTPELRAKYETKNETPAAPKFAPRVAAIKQRVDAAAKKTDTAPTQAQAKAGNYTKGSVKIHGLDVSIENPEGSIRRNKDPKGPKWEVKMPAHYGYVKRTEGADGDQVDVYVGKHPESQHVFVIDQNNLESGQFDEHKAMLGYQDAVTALHAYEKSFSDGKGLERIGKITPMTVDEFKSWLAKGDTRSPAGDVVSAGPAFEPTDDQIRGVMKQLRQIELKSAKTVRAPDGTEFPVLHTDTVAGALNAIKIPPTGISAQLYPLIRKRLLELVPDVQLSYVSPETMQQLIARSKGSLHATTAGYHHLQRSTGKDFIVLDASRLVDPKVAAHIVLHETTHAATMHAITQDYDTGGGVLSRMIQDVMEEAGSTNPLLYKTYGYGNPSEFIAEALSNPTFQGDLAAIPISPELAGRLHMSRWKAESMWSAVVDVVRRLLGLPPNYHTALEAALRLSDHLMANNVSVRQYMARRSRPQIIPAEHDVNLDGVITSSMIDIQRSATELFTRAERQEQVGSPKLLGIRTADQVAQTADNYYAPTMDGKTPVRVVVDETERMRVTGQRILEKTEPLIKKLYDLERKYKGKVWENFTSLVHDETMAGVYADKSLADNTQLGKDTLAGAWGKARHAELNARWHGLPDDLKAARREAMDYFTRTQNEMSLGIIKNRILKALGIEDDALALRIHEERTTDDDAERLGPSTLDLILDAKELSKIKGPYFPLMRRGDWVVRAQYKITPPGNALRQIDDNTWEFAKRDDAIKFATHDPGTGRVRDTKPTPKSVWVDKNTGLQYGVEDGKEVRITSKDADSEQRFRVTVQDRHVEMVDSEKEALEIAAELKKKPDVFKDVAGVVARRYEPSGRNTDILSSRLERLAGVLENRDGYKKMTPAAQREVKNALNEVAIQYLGSTRIQSHRLPRRYVEGQSNDLTRNTLEYAQSSSGYLAKLKHQPRIEEALKEMRDQADGDFGKNTSVGRSVIANEMEKRVASNNGFDENTKVNRIFGRVLTASFLDKLFSPAYNIINATQPTMVTMPVLAGRHKIGRAVAEMSRAYNDVAGFSIIKQAVGDTARKVGGSQERTNYLSGVLGRLRDPREREAIQRLADLGSIDPDAGLEIAALIKSRDGDMGRIDQGLGYLEGIARQMPRAIETINRTVTALAAYRLEMSKTNDHEKAIAYAQKTVNNTQGLYSNTNAAPIFNHPLAKLSLQFKKYGQMMYHLLGQEIGKAFHGKTREEKIEGMKTLAYIAGTHVTMAGVLGLPTEPFKYLLLGAKAAGLTAIGWEDVEQWGRQQISSAVGPRLGEVIAKGLPRAAGLDLSSRVGLDSLISFGEPKSDKKNDVKAYMWDLVAGAPGSLVGDWISGANAMATGDLAKGAELLTPLKFASDSIKAYRLATEGKKSETGRQLSEPYGIGEAAARAIGFTPAREAEEGAKAAAFRRQTASDQADRSKVINGWVNAKGADKVKAQKAVQEYNKTAPKDLRITPKDLNSAVKRREDQGVGISTTRRTQPVLDRLDQVYNAL